MSGGDGGERMVLVVNAREQGRRGLAAQRGVVRLHEELDDATVLLAEGGADGEKAFDEATALLAVRPETRLAPDDGESDLSLTEIVRRLHTLVIHEREEGGEELQHLLAHARDGRTSALPELEQSLEVEAEIGHRTSESEASHRAVPNPMPVLENGLGG